MRDPQKPPSKPGAARPGQPPRSSAPPERCLPSPAAEPVRTEALPRGDAVRKKRPQRSVTLDAEPKTGTLPSAPVPAVTIALCARAAASKGPPSSTLAPERRGFPDGHKHTAPHSAANSSGYTATRKHGDVRHCRVFNLREGKPVTVCVQKGKPAAEKQPKASEATKM